MTDEEHEDFYITACRAIIERFSELLGDKTALIKARKAPIQISAEGKIVKYYGEGEEALRVLIHQYEDVFGSEVALKKARTAIQPIIDEHHKDLPDELDQTHPRKDVSLFTRLRRWTRL